MKKRSDISSDVSRALRGTQPTGSKTEREKSAIGELRQALQQAERQLAEAIQSRDAMAASSAADQERLRKQLHDGLGQYLTSMSFLATAARTKFAAQNSDVSELDEIVRLANLAVRESQSVAALLQRRTPDLLRPVLPGPPRVSS